MIYVYDKKSGKMVPKGEAESYSGTNIMSDIQPYKSMIDGRMITSRSQHRNHLRDHGCIEVGNEKMTASPPPKADRTQSKRMIADQLWNVSDRDIRKLAKRLTHG